MYAQELFVHDSSKGERAKGIHACVIQTLGVLVFT